MAISTVKPERKAKDMFLTGNVVVTANRYYTMLRRRLIDFKEYESKINALLDVLDELEVAGESVGFTRITLRNLKQNGKKYKKQPTRF